MNRPQMKDDWDEDGNDDDEMYCVSTPAKYVYMLDRERHG